MICPVCRREIEDDSLFCRFCGAEFTDEEDEEVIEVIREDEEEYVQQPPVGKSSVKQKKTVGILLVVIAVLVILFGVIMCIFLGQGTSDKEKEKVTDASGEVVRPGFGTTEITVSDAEGNTRVIETDKSLVTPSQILQEYTDVMNTLKTDAPAFEMIRYQNLPTDKQNLGAVADMVLPIIEKYVTSAAAAEKVSYIAGNSDKLPVKNSTYGCLLTDAAAIKNAYCEIMSDDIYKLVITFNDELNPQHLPAGATSSTGIINAVFDPYDAAEQITAISSMVMNDINFNYTDCTVTLVYNHNTKQVQSINMTMNIDITADTILMAINARIVDVTEFDNFTY